RTRGATPRSDRIIDHDRHLTADRQRRDLSDAEAKQRRRSETAKRPCRTFARKRTRSVPCARRKKTRGQSRTMEKIRIWPGCDGGRKSRSIDWPVRLCAALSAAAD